MKDQLIVFARSPFHPKVKTRLAHGIGQKAAQGIYARLIYSLLYRLIERCPEDTKITLSVASQSGVDTFKAAYPELDVNHQSTGNIGVRMSSAIKKAMNDGAERVVLIGSDLPELDWSLIQQAFNKIGPDTITLGPTMDGGFYLVGMQVPAKDIFQNVSWSTDEVLTRTVNNIKAVNCNPVFLPQLQDIDWPEDWERWQAKLSK